MHPIQDISPFINLNLHTVPITGTRLYRNPKGKKTGYTFPTDWQEKYKATLNDESKALGGLLTVKGGIVAIDCDDTQSYDLFRQLDPENTAIFESIGKLDNKQNPVSSCTILYTHTKDLPPSKRLKGKMDLDWYNGTGMVFLPTEANETKESWHVDTEGNLLNHNKDKVVIKPMPPIVLQVLNIILAKDVEIIEKSVANTTHSRRTKGYLGKVLNNFNFKDLAEDRTYIPELSKLLTPLEYRSALYHKQGHIHPQDVGVRHDYLFSIMCRLAGDNTVDPDLAKDVIMWVNSLLDPPRSEPQMRKEVYGGIISGKQTNPAGEPYWEYDENWESLRSWTAVTKDGGELLDIFYDKFRRSYIVYNTETDYLDTFTKKGEVMEYIVSTTIGDFNQKEVQQDMNLVKTLVEPTEDFGYINDDTEFNLFKPTKALRILNDPTRYEQHYKEPTAFINYMEHFMPNEQQRTYFLSLIRTKLTTFDYSPVVPYIIGVPGSGKGLLMTILANLVGDEYVAKEVSGGLFISPFNKGWLENKFFANLNELAEGLQNKSERTKAIGDFKLYSGSEYFQCHGKGRDPYTAPQRAMFIMTANSNPLAIEDNDRRVYYITTPNTFDSSPQCRAADSSRDIYKTIVSQMEDIAYYLATEVENLSANEYTTAPKNKDKMKAILETSKDDVERAVILLQMEEWKQLSDHLLEHKGTTRFLSTKNKGRIIIANLADDIQAMNNGEVDDPSEKDKDRAIVQEILSRSKLNLEKGKTRNVLGSRRKWSKQTNHNSFAFDSLHKINIETVEEPLKPIDPTQIEEEDND